MAGGVVAFRSDLGPRAGPGFVGHGGDDVLPLGPGVTAWPFGSL